MVSPEGQSHSKRKFEHATKKCPECYVHLPLNARECHACKAKVGDVDKLGFAEKPVDWLGYLVAGVSILAFSVFMWWAFFREQP
jgi:ribosomal protein L40E